MIIPYQRSKVQPETERGIAEARLVKEKSATRGTLCRRECSYTGTENIGRRIEHKHHLCFSSQRILNKWGNLKEVSRRIQEKF